MSKKTIGLPIGSSGPGGKYQVEWNVNRVTFGINVKHSPVLEIHMQGGFFNSKYEFRPGNTVSLHPEVSIAYDLFTKTIVVECPAVAEVTKL